MPTINNYTFSEPVFTVPEQSNIVSQVGATAVITITPNTGFTATAGDFSVASFNTTYISGVVFTQSGTNVLCTITLINTTTMPSNNLTLGICVSGDAVAALITIAGTVSANVSSTNVTGDSSETNTAYSNSGTPGTSESLFTRSYAAALGYYWPPQGSLVPSINITTGNQSNYTLQQTPTNDSQGRLTGIAYDVLYNYPTQNITGDHIDIVIPTPLVIFTAVPKINGYLMKTTILTNVSENRTLTVFGIPASVFDATINDGTTTTSLVSGGVIPSSGQLDTLVNFPTLASGGANKTYTITLSGTNVGTLSQANPFTIKQLDSITVRFKSTTANPITGFTNVTKNVKPLQNTPFLSNTELSTGIWYCSVDSRVTVSSGSMAIAKSVISNNDYTNASITANATATSSQTNVTQITVDSTTGAAAGDKFNRQEERLNPDTAISNVFSAPFEHSVVSVDSATQLTVTPAISLNNNEPISLLRNNGTQFSIYESSVTLVNSTTVDIKAKIAITSYGDADIDFDLKLDNLITYTP